jgi:hypothetical protein
MGKNLPEGGGGGLAIEPQPWPAFLCAIRGIGPVAEKKTSQVRYQVAIFEGSNPAPVCGLCKDAPSYYIERPRSAQTARVSQARKRHPPRSLGTRPSVIPAGWHLGAGTLARRLVVRVSCQRIASHHFPGRYCAFQVQAHNARSRRV